MFLDASAIIAIIGEEEDAAALLSRLEAAETPLCYSPLSAYEAIVGFARKKSDMRVEATISPGLIDGAKEIVETFLAEIGAVEIDVTPDIRRGAISACKLYGRQVGHPAKLNFGDCFAYACARSVHAPLLYKGDDFSHTDIG